MNWKNIKAYLKFTRLQRAGILILFLIIIMLQLIYFFVDFTQKETFFSNKEQWLSLQNEINEAKLIHKNESHTVKSFNPNFISDYKGYKLGLSVKEMDRLLEFRKENKFVNSAEEFQEVTKVSDSLLATISPFFKFPDWIKNKSNFKSEKKEYAQKADFKKEVIKVLDINQASPEDLIKIYGIGEALSARIIKQREIVGYFVSMEQMNEIWGLSADVVAELNSHFKVVLPSDSKKIAINDASLKELSQFSYFRYALAKQIVTYRSMNGNFNNIEDLSKIKGFPVEKAKIIALYLEF
ncbi:competence ComEA-like helix-hairpin-helix protein [Flavobacterium cutihirudinis]|uniref:Competence ComEA-like helix-hairpin-helix protein n=1 Tax=Flavobacterium cutihirudinis TaxID=1265740 RepID=A0A3D9FP14_9FLAO|nr:helix-hairpin-helix domain-containing protein [Flavobacterium cutihirudinis]RED22162.1 competence ComEA-like helix-hairpin-helix protein [Flavobacterium cutihirudinis]